MKKIEDFKKIIGQHKQDLEQNFKVRKIAIFGSYARGEQTEKSDLDILVEFKEPVGFLFVHLANYLEKILGIEVDLLTDDGIKPNRKVYVKRDLIYV